MILFWSDCVEAPRAELERVYGEFFQKNLDVVRLRTEVQGSPPALRGQSGGAVDRGCGWGGGLLSVLLAQLLRLDAAST